MPWDNNTGGGGRGGNGGPWGQAPQGGGPRRGGGGTPNLEEILNRGRDSLQGGLPGGRWAIVGGVLVLVVLWLTQCVYVVQPQEAGVETVFGKPKEQLSEQGLHFMFWPIEQVEKVNLTENQTEISSVNSGASRNEGLMLTGDQNIVDVSFSVLWRVATPPDFLFNVRDPQDMVRRTAESAMREVVGRRPAQDIFRDNRASIAIEVQKITQQILDSYGTGVNVNQISIKQVAPPAEVADAFDEVQRAEQDQTRFQEEARQYANTKLGDARGQAAQVREEAAAYKDRVVKDAEGQTARFNSIYNEYIKAPEVTRKRLYLETMEQVLGDSNKLVVEKGASGSGVIPYLPLPELKGTSTSSGAPSSLVNTNQGSGQ
ncbi:MAG TPA: FtsH protease activity modulator HflK [Devosiaceae bacterium]